MSEETNIPQMRETIERLSKDKGGLQKELTELQTQLRVRDAREAFREAGYNPKHGDLYAAVNPEGELTVDAVSAFATEQSLPPVTTQEAPKEAEGSTSEEAEGTAQLDLLSGGGSRAGEGGAGGANQQSLTRQEWKQLYASDPAAAKAAVASGRVQISSDNVYVARGPVAAGTNPYVPSPRE